MHEKVTLNPGLKRRQIEQNDHILYELPNDFLYNSNRVMYDFLNKIWPNVQMYCGGRGLQYFPCNDAKVKA